MKLIIVGCGRVGAQLANRLYQQGHHVTVIDQVAAAFDNLDPSFRGRTLEGDVLAQDMLRRANIESTDGLAATTSSDSLNVVIAHVARTVYHVPNVIARNYESRWWPLYEAFGVHTVSSSTWAAQRIEEMLSDASLITVFSAGNGEVEIYEVMLPKEYDRVRLGDLLSPGVCAAVALTRAGKATLPTADTVLEAGDVLHVSATFEGITALRKRLGLAKEA